MKDAETQASPFNPMADMRTSQFYVILFGVFFAALLGGLAVFFNGMQSSIYLIHTGVDLMEKYLDKPRYDMNLTGMVFTLAFLTAAFLFILFMLLVSEEAVRKAPGPPQPMGAPQPATAFRRRGPEPAPQPAFQPSPQPAFQSSPQAVFQTPQAQPAVQPHPVSAPAAVPAAGPAPTPQAVAHPAPAQPAPTVDQITDEVIEDIPVFNEEGTDASEGNVIYGHGRIDEEDMLEFIQENPDSAVKFLYRKSLDNKPLSPIDEDIYRAWERRGMTRGRVRQMVLTIMGWPGLPDEFPHDVWRKLRDQVFDMRGAIKIT
ncbi:MAG: hypothetical protein OEV94_08515 [Deltaproteobacteria bacterium]|nr:hypothetical protein [Deltaproteobacteria bacterium]